MFRGLPFGPMTLRSTLPYQSVRTASVLNPPLKAAAVGAFPDPVTPKSMEPYTNMSKTVRLSGRAQQYVCRSNSLQQSDIG
jgi:hypothetical protein